MGASFECQTLDSILDFVGGILISLLNPLRQQRNSGLRESESRSPTHASPLQCRLALSLPAPSGKLSSQKVNASACGRFILIKT